MHEFTPKEVYVDQRVQSLELTQRILNHYKDIPVTVITDKSQIKFPQDHTRAKKQLFLAHFEGEAVKSCQGLGDYVCCDYHTLTLVSDCHLECTYCILQDYLKNNPVITVYTNLEEILGQLAQKITARKTPLRVGTGELSDSLALDHITGFSKELVAFANQHPQVMIEFKTKTANVQNLLSLNHQGNIVVSWSVNPQSYIQKEEHKCATLDQRLKAARACADQGYLIGFHLDPLLHLDNWQQEYQELVQTLSNHFVSTEIAWISLGSLRFTPNLKKIVNERFPKSQLMTGELYPSADGKIRYFRPLREQMYKTVSGYLEQAFDKTPHYLCMETKTVWQRSLGHVPENIHDLESKMAASSRFAV